jgi:S1-C subfamily serine protease
MRSIKIFIFLLFLGWATPIFGGPDIDKYIDSVVKVEFKNRTATGFLISKDGYILTCGHVFEGYEEQKDSDSIKVYLFEPTQIAYNVPLVHLRLSKEKGSTLTSANLQEKYADYALLKVPASNIGTRDPFELAPSPPPIGAPTYFFAAGATHTPRLAKRTVQAANPTFLLLSPSVHPGDSGSPLLNSSGQLVGMVLMQHTSSFGGAVTAPHVNKLLPPAYSKILDGQD